MKDVDKQTDKLKLNFKMLVITSRFACTRNTKGA